MGGFRTRLVTEVQTAGSAKFRATDRMRNGSAVKQHFERLDQSYLDDLVIKAGRGSSNAFAELFTAVADRQMYYLTLLTGNRDEALVALRDVFISALTGISGITRPGLFMLWISRLSANAALERTGQEKAQNGRYTLSQLLNLPLAESQIMMMSLEQGLNDGTTADILNIRKGTVRRFKRLAQKHLSKNAFNASAAEDPVPTKNGTQYLSDGASKLSPLEISEMLDSIFEACGRDPNTLPAESLASYAVYRKERFSLQRGILALSLAVFLMLPALFMIPHLMVNEADEGERGLPVVTINVRSMLPVGKVKASIRSHSLPVYEAGAKEFTVEPIRNGSMKIEVELINRQKAGCEIDISSVDSEGPELVGSESSDKTFRIDVEDSGIGVDYREIYAVSASGEIYYPIVADSENGVVFEYPGEKWDIYIPDHIGNTLHLAVSLE